MVPNRTETKGDHEKKKKNFEAVGSTFFSFVYCSDTI